LVEKRNEVSKMDRKKPFFSGTTLFFLALVLMVEVVLLTSNVPRWVDVLVGVLAGAIVLLFTLNKMWMKHDLKKAEIYHQTIRQGQQGMVEMHGQTVRGFTALSLADRQLIARMVDEGWRVTEVNRGAGGGWALNGDGGRYRMLNPQQLDYFYQVEDCRQPAHHHQLPPAYLEDH
jgi:hypothetical protein